MFWSHDLLGKKTALGAVWIAAHGKKLNKGRIMQVDVTEACKKVMDPEVPQALRLQAILVGGIVIVHARQQVYLLEDAQEALRKLRGLDGKAEAAGAAARLTLGEGKAVAREEAITLPLGADLGHYAHLGDLFPFALGGPALSEGGASGRSQQLGEGLFVMPSLPDGLSQGTAPGAGGATNNNRRRRAKGGRLSAAAAAAAAAGGEVQSGGAAAEPGYLLAAGRQGGGGEAEEVEMNLEGLPRHDLELMDGPELLPVPDVDVLFGMGEVWGGAGAAAAGMEGADGGMAPPPLDDLMPVPEPFELHGGDLAHPAGSAGAARPTPSQATATSSERSRGSRGSAGAAAAGQAGRRRRGNGGVRRRRAIVDDFDTLQIRARDYREWMNDRSDLLVLRPRRPAPPPPGGSGAAKSGLVGAPPAWLPPGLQELYSRTSTLPKPQAGPRSKKGKGGAAAVEEGEGVGEDRERYLEEQAAVPLPHDDGGFFGGAFGGVDGLEMGAGQFGYGMEEDGLLPEAARGEGGAGGSGGGGNPFQRSMWLQEQERGEGSRLGSEGEVDVETERLRAALNGTAGSEPYYLQQQGLTPASADQARPGSATGAGRGGRGKRGSGLLRRDSEGSLSERSSEGRRPGGSRRLSDLLEGGGGLGGGEDLGALLPAVGEDEPFLEGRKGVQEEEEGEEEEEEQGRRKRRTTDDGLSAGGGTGTGTYGTLSQFELLEASGPTQAQHGGGGGAPHGDGLQRQTVAFIGVMRGRFDAAESQLAAEGGGADGEPGPCQLSFFGMAARLSRMDAAKLFYQTLQARSHGFLAAAQQEPFGDILLSRGRFL